MNELEHVARLRGEVPLSAGTDTEVAVLAVIRAEAREPALARGNRSRAVPRRPRAALAVGLALAVCAGAAIGIQASRSPGRPAALPSSQVIAWSGRAAAPWPPAPSYGTAHTAAQLIAYVNRAAAVAPGHAPKPHEWVVVKLEQAQSSRGGGGFLFGPPDERLVTLQWIRVDGCASTSAVVVPPGLSPASTLTGQLTIHPASCDQADLAGWKSYSYKYLDSLPTDPAALESVILANNPPGGVIPTRTDAIFDAIYNLLANGEPLGAVIPPKLSAALYRIMRQLPGVHFESDTDLAGRKGLGFYVVLEGYIKEELMIDPLTYRYMGYKDIGVTDHADTGTDGTRYIKKGHVLGWEALLGSAIVQHPGQLP